MYFIIAGNASFVKEISLLYPGADWGGEPAAIRDILQKSFNPKAQHGLMAKVGSCCAFFLWDPLI